MSGDIGLSEIGTAKGLARRSLRLAEGNEESSSKQNARQNGWIWFFDPFLGNRSPKVSNSDWPKLEPNVTSPMHGLRDVIRVWLSVSWFKWVIEILSRGIASVNLTRTTMERVLLVEQR